jgi:hypothetical protein
MNVTIIRTSHSTRSVKMLKGCEVIIDKVLGSEVLTVNCLNTTKHIVRTMRINVVTVLALNLQSLKS